MISIRLKPIPTKPVIKIERNKRSPGESTNHKEQTKSQTTADDATLASDIMSSNTNASGINASRSNQAAGSEYANDARNILESRSEGMSEQILMMVKFEKDNIKMYSDSRLKGTMQQIKNFAISNIEVSSSKHVLIMYMILSCNKGLVIYSPVAGGGRIQNVMTLRVR